MPDVSVNKGFTFAEQGRVSAGAILTNMFSRHQFNTLNVNIDSPAFGTFGDSGPARTLQLYVKLVF